MKLQKLKRILAVVLIGSVFTTMSVQASDVQTSSMGEVSQEAEEEGMTSEAEETTKENIENTAAEEIPEEDDRKEEETGRAESIQEEAVQADERTEALTQEYKALLKQARTKAVGSYSSELAKFPASYQTYLKQLHSKHPNWVFVAVNKSLNWNDIIAAESISGSSSGTNRSLLPKTSASLLLSKASTDYNASKGTYIHKDGSTWVSASKPAVAYYVDPRNFLTEDYIFLFEALAYNSSYHTKAGVDKVLQGTDLGGSKVGTYITTSGKQVSNKLTYSQMVYAAGEKNKVSPLFLAAKIRQETGAKLTNGSISGNYSFGGKSYRGYYNFYNIGAYSTSTGSAIANGLVYAKGGSSNSKSYTRPWISPALAIEGGAQFLASSYIARGQNTVYFQRFNTAVSPYYQHQYMQNLTGAASEAKTTYNSYKGMGILEDSYVFYIPVYKNMPSQSGNVSIKKTVKTGKTVSSVTLRKGPSTGYSAVTTIPAGKTVTVSDAVYTDMSVSVSGQQQNPYWYKISYGSKTGYVSYKYIKMNADSVIKPGEVKQLSVSAASGEKIYYETSNPAVAAVSSSGKITGVKNGTCDIYAVSGSGKKMDAIGITVSGSAASEPTSDQKPSLAAPKMISLSNSTSGVVVKWGKVSGAKGYYVYRKTSGNSYKRIKTITSGATVKYTDKTMPTGKKYTYTVRAYKGSVTSGYKKSGLTIRRLSNPKVISAAGTTRGIKVKWKKVKSAVEYEVYRKTKNGQYQRIKKLEGTDKLSYYDKTAKKGVTYYYTVRACSGKYKGAYTSAGIKGKRK